MQQYTVYLLPHVQLILFKYKIIRILHTMGCTV